MTTYEDNLAADEQVALIELYRFARGTNYDHFTNNHEDITFNSETYKAVTIKRSEFKRDSNLSAVTCNVTLAMRDDLGVYIASQPAERTTVKIYRAVSDDLTEFITVIDGQATGISFDENNSCSVKVVEKASILDRNVDMIIHSSACNHNVFYGYCGLDPLLWKLVTSNTVFSDGVIYSPDFTDKADHWYQAGEVHIGEDARLITEHIGNAITLHIPFPDTITDGTEIEIYPGCDRLPYTCLNKFDNLDNYLGMPYIPSKNPAIWGL